MPFSARTAECDALRQFARDVSREVVVRCGNHPAGSDRERIQAAQGPCEIWMLDAVRDRVASEAAGYFGDVDAAGWPITGDVA